MEFIKKNGAKIVIAAIALTGLVLMLIYLFSINQLPEAFQPDFMGLTMVIGYAIFFAGVVAVCVCSILNVCKCIRGWILLVVGVLVTTFMSLALADTIQNWEHVYRPFGTPQHLPAEDTWAKFVIFPVVVQLFVFGLFPLVKGAKKLLCSKKED
ncbi:MAG: hypothetical protein FWE16_04365 [Firmicutes bacterium]|nr:hypothetical protein [Bacillota bacterium]